MGYVSNRLEREIKVSLLADSSSAEAAVGLTVAHRQ